MGSTAQPHQSREEAVIFREDGLEAASSCLELLPKPVTIVRFCFRVFFAFGCDLKLPSQLIKYLIECLSVPITNPITGLHTLQGRHFHIVS